MSIHSKLLLDFSHEALLLTRGLLAVTAHRAQRVGPDTFTVADAYLFVVAGWGKHVGVDISGLSHLGAFMARVAARPSVQDALRAEGLIK